MGMDAKVRKLINEQIGHEFHAAYLYLAMAGHFEHLNLEGFGAWFETQAKEEVGHAMRLYRFLIERGERVELTQIAQPPSEFGTPLEAMRKALEHEQKVTGQINAMYQAAQAANDYATQIMLQWFITEQVEEENLTSSSVDRLEMAGDNRAALLMLDTEFGSRTGEE